MTGSPIEVLLVMFIALAVIHAFVTPPADTRWRDEIVRAIIELEARQRLAHPELTRAPAPARVIDVSVVEPAEARRAVPKQPSGRASSPAPPAEPEPDPLDLAPESPPPGRYARVPVDPGQVRDWSDDTTAPPWSATKDRRVSAAEQRAAEERAENERRRAG